MAVTKEVYMGAEEALLSWIDICIANNLSIAEIVFILQFRIFDINNSARVSYKEFTSVGDNVKVGGTNQ